ncbi:MAG: hypothetical protein GXP63_06555 [DPANN group archaeon]|nr:hypothetical protein [DPANN group archaeon]
MTYEQGTLTGGIARMRPIMACASEEGHRIVFLNRYRKGQPFDMLPEAAGEDPCVIETLKLPCPG